MSSTNRLKETLQVIGGLFGYVIFLAICIGFVVLFLKGATFVTERFMPILITISSIVFWPLLVIALPLTLIKKTRGVLSIIFLISSYLFGVTGWLMGFALTYYFWGLFWVFVGLFIAGVGVVPFGLLATAFHGEWGYFWNLLIVVIVTYGSRIFAYWLAEKYDTYHYEQLSGNNVIDAEDENLIINSIPGQTLENYVNQSNFTIGDISSMLLVGETGSGKTELVRAQLEKLKRDYKPSDVSFVLFDLKQVEFSDEDVSYLYKDIITKPAEGIRILKELDEFADLRIKKHDKFPAIIIYIEECDIAATHQEKFDNLLVSLVRKAKLANFCVIYSTSRVSPDTVSKKLLGNFEVLLASRLPLSATQYLGIEDTREINKYDFVYHRLEKSHEYTHPTSTDDFDTLVQKARKLVKEKQKASTAMFQRELHIGYGTAARIMESLEDEGLVGPSNGSVPRSVYVDKSKSHTNNVSVDELEDWETIKNRG